MSEAFVAEPQRTRVLAAGAAASIVVFALYWRTAWSMAETWLRSDTFAHGLVVFPVALWLAWQRRSVLAQLPIGPFWPGLLVAVGAGLLWLFSDLAVVVAGRQFGFVFMLQAALLTVLGWRCAKAFSFPLLFLLFAVPFGEFLLPTLMEWTADFTVATLRLTGIPVYREGMDFVIPSGTWSVVEGCSGIRYLIASLMGGTLFAYLAYRSTWRRIGFIALAIVVPIIANWIRAYLIVMIGHLSDNKLAAGVDHFIYGWVFFGVVIFALFWLGSLWRESSADAAQDPTARPSRTTIASGRGAMLAAVIVALTVGIWPAMARQLNGAEKADDFAIAPVVAPAGWESMQAPITDWKPRFSGYRSEAMHTFARGSDRVGVYLAYYRAQSDKHVLISSNNVLATADDPVWRAIASGAEPLDWNGASTTVRRAELTSDPMRLLALHTYWVDGRVTASAQYAKILLALAKLRGRGDDSAAIVLYATKRGDRNDWQPLARSAEELAPSIARALDATRASREH